MNFYCEACKVLKEPNPLCPECGIGSKRRRAFFSIKNKKGRGTKDKSEAVAE